MKTLKDLQKIFEMYWKCEMCQKYTCNVDWHLQSIQVNTEHHKKFGAFYFGP